MKKINIVQFIGSMNMGGSETLLINIYRHIDREKYQFIFMENVPEKTYYTDEIEQLGGKIVKAPVFSARNTYSYYKFLVKYFRNNNTEIVHAHTYLHSWIVLAAAKKAGVKKRIAHAHSAMPEYNNGSRLKWNLLKKLLMHYATDLIACSEAARDDLFRGSTDALIIKNPVDLSRFSTIDKQTLSKLRKECSISNNDLVIGHIGRMSPPKNSLFICEIARILKARGVHFKLLWLGDGELRSEIEQYIKKHSLENQIILTGIVKNVPEYIRLFDIFIMPSLFEGLSLAAVEVRSQGIPCLFSSTTSSDTKINSNVLFLPIDDSEYWVSKIVNHDKSMSERDAAQNIVDKGFSIEAVTKRFELCYKN